MPTIRTRLNQNPSAAWLALLLVAVLALAHWPGGYRAGHATRRPAEKQVLVAASEGALSALRAQPSLSPGEPPAELPIPFDSGMSFEIARAKLLNASQPFARSAAPEARPFAFSGNEVSRERAIDCLASAMWYEAGSDSRGQQAVGQVVLNRVRHPAFPATVCGVVFQGADRSTGCQFTFTCDGAMRRSPSPLAFARARVEARALLDGVVDPQVGLATHYHTDWVRPAWSGAMDKIAQVETHLFFRWPGKRGEASAALRRYAGDEPEIAPLAGISPAHRLISPAEMDAYASTLSPPAARTEPLTGTARRAEAAELAPAQSPRRLDPSGGIFQLTIVPSGNGGAQAMAALDVCGDRSFCKVLGRSSPGLSSSVGAPQDIIFLYVRDKRTGVDRAFWNCDLFNRSNRNQCLTSANRSWIAFDGNLQTASSQPRRVL